MPYAHFMVRIDYASKKLTQKITRYVERPGVVIRIVGTPPVRVANFTRFQKFVAFVLIPGATFIFAITGGDVFRGGEFRQFG